MSKKQVVGYTLQLLPLYINIVFEVKVLCPVFHLISISVIYEKVKGGGGEGGRGGVVRGRCTEITTED